ncbi:hypothetical protein JOF47_000162 [Paeniglutamicibacter kerguelensis]|uniref:Uncharacterized protein n=1 Tax=Paeniglutamicibacter kerguelensis TaxID=254788 RepID=A0ABS4X859_9MICC|nr:hypothetical protein [Paeniglutamicibacter kerguelensis]
MLSSREENAPFRDGPEGNKGAGANQRKNGQRFDTGHDGNHHLGPQRADPGCGLGNGTSCIRRNQLHIFVVGCWSCKVQHRVPTQQAKRDQRISHTWLIVVCPCLLCCLGPGVPRSVFCQPHTLGNHYPHIGNRPRFRPGGSFVVQCKKPGPQKGQDRQRRARGTPSAGNARTPTSRRITARLRFPMRRRPS